MDGVNNWMNEIDVFLTSEDAAVGDSETFQAQLTESEVWIHSLTAAYVISLCVFVWYLLLQNYLGVSTLHCLQCEFLLMYTD